MILDKEHYKYDHFFKGLLRLFKAMSFSLKTFLLGPKSMGKSSSDRGVVERSLVGAPLLKVDEVGHLKCTSCQLCAFICPSACIELASSDPQALEGAPPAFFNLEILRCTFCKLCEDVCPEDAISLSDHENLAGFGEEEWLWDHFRLGVRHMFKNPEGKSVQK